MREPVARTGGKGRVGSGISVAPRLATVGDRVAEEPRRRAGRVARFPFPAILSDSSGFLFRLATSTIHQMASESLEDLGISPQKYGILCVISCEGPLTQQQVGDRMKVDRTSIVMLVDSLEKLGAVVRGANPLDRRVHCLSITPMGRQLLIRAGRRLNAAQARFLEPLSKSEWTELKRILAKLLGHHHGAAAEESRRPDRAKA